MGLKAILHTLIDHVDESHGVDKGALHREVDGLTTEIESTPAPAEPTEPGGASEPTEPTSEVSEGG